MTSSGQIRGAHEICGLDGLSKKMVKRENMASELVHSCLNFVKLHRQMPREDEPLRLLQ